MNSNPSWKKTITFAVILAAGLAAGVLMLGKMYADEATTFHRDIQTLTEAAIKPESVPSDYKAPEPTGFFAKQFAKHPNNEIVKGLAFALDADGFAKAHPNNEAARAYSLLSDPQDFIAKHPNNELARTLQILTDTKGFYTGHKHNDLARTLHVILDPDDFIEKHPNNDLGKAMQLLKGDIATFRKAHPNNEVTRALDSIEHPKERLAKIFGW